MKSLRSKLLRSKPRNAINTFWGKWFLLAIAMGFLAGFAAIIFQYCIQGIQHLTLSQWVGFRTDEAVGDHSRFGETATALNIWFLLPIITIGGLVSGMLVYWLAPEAAGSGADGAIDAFHNKRGLIPLRVPIVKTLASAVTLGTGGSAGREGPIAQIGAGIGSCLAQVFRLSTHERRVMLAIGMGASVGGIFRAPLAGAIFASEILYRDADLEADVIIPGALASTIAYSVFQMSLPVDLRFTPLFGDLVQYQVVDLTELLPYTVLAFLLVAFSIGYVKTFQWTTKLFDWIPIAPHFKPMIGAFLAGLITIVTYLVLSDQLFLAGLGSGYGLLQKTLLDATSVGLSVLFGVAALKMLTTSLTIGSGGAGGVFGPSMVIGGMVGAGTGKLLNSVAPNLTPHPSALAIVGAAGFFAGCANAPFSTILMVTEMTGSYKLLLPTLWVTTICFILCRKWSLYSHQVNSRIESPAHMGDFTVDLLEGVQVRDVFRETDEGITFHEEASLDEIVHALAKSTQRYYHVYNSSEELVGVFSAEDVRKHLYDDLLWTIVNAQDVMTESIVKLRLDDDLNHALGQFTALNVDELPVVSDENANQVLGVLRRKETIAAYNKLRLELQKKKDEESS